jgi:hypothetical protein
MLERGTPLNEVVVQEPEVTTLGEDSSLVVERAILEVEHQPATHSIAMGDLNEVTVGESLARQRPQNQKSMDQAFGVANSDWGSPHCSSLKQRGPGHQDSDQGEPNTLSH